MRGGTLKPLSNKTMLSLVNLPEPETFFSAISSWSSPFFDELKPIMFFAVGIFLGVVFVQLILKLVSWVANRIH